MSEDPLVDVDSPNLYAFVEWKPNMGTDPLGLYQLDVHYYGIYYLSRAAGFSPRAATRIARSSQYVDDSIQGSPDPYQGKGLRNLALAHDRLVALHFPAREGSVVIEGAPEALSAARAAARSPNLARLGVSLHTLADSYSHADFTLEHDEQNLREGSWKRLNKGHADSGHAGHEPDLPFEDTGKAWRMANSVLSVLQEAYVLRTGKVAPRVDMQQLEQDLEHLFSMEFESEELRSAAWRGFIEGRLGDTVVPYDRSAPGPEPPGFDSAIQEHVRTVQELLDREEEP